MEKPRAEDTAVEDRSILIKSTSTQNVCTSCFCRHEKILQSVSFPRNGKSFLHCQQLPLLNIARNLKCLPEDYSMILTYFIPPDVLRLWGRMDYCQRSCSQDNLNVGLRTHRAAQPSNAPVSGWSQLANICRLPNERSIYIYIAEASEWNTSISHADTQIPSVALPDSRWSTNVISHPNPTGNT